MLDDRGVTLSHGPRENRHRPSIDVLFRSAAIAYGRRATGVLLSGFFDDGTAGLSAINRRGGMAVVQDPDDAEFPDLPQNALEYGAVDICVPVSEMASRLMAIAREPVHAGDDPVPVDLAAETARPAERKRRWKSSTVSASACRRRAPNAAERCGSSSPSTRAIVATSAMPTPPRRWRRSSRSAVKRRCGRRCAVSRKTSGSPSARAARGRAGLGPVHEDSARASAAHAEVLHRLLQQADAAVTINGQDSSGS